MKVHDDHRRPPNVEARRNEQQGVPVVVGFVLPMHAAARRSMPEPVVGIDVQERPALHRFVSPVGEGRRVEFDQRELVRGCHGLFRIPGGRSSIRLATGGDHRADEGCRNERNDCRSPRREEWQLLFETGAHLGRAPAAYVDAGVIAVRAGRRNAKRTTFPLAIVEAMAIPDPKEERRKRNPLRARLAARSVAPPPSLDELERTRARSDLATPRNAVSIRASRQRPTRRKTSPWRHRSSISVPSRNWSRSPPRRGRCFVPRQPSRRRGGVPATSSASRSATNSRSSRASSENGGPTA